MNKTQAHTPGPWRVSQQTNTDDILADTPTDAGEVFMVASVHRPFWFDRDEAEANARLIAAAPETAAELERVRAVNVELLEANSEAETAIGENLQWLTDQFKIEVTQKDPETLRKLAQLGAAWESLLQARPK